MTHPKAAPTRLDPSLYESLRQLVQRRDGWRCQSCGTMSNLEIHHKQLRSHSGEDSEENLITLCAACHARVHRPGSMQLSPRTHGKPLDCPRGSAEMSGCVALRSRLAPGLWRGSERTWMGVQDAAARCRQSPWIAAGSVRLVYCVADAERTLSNGLDSW